MQQIRQKSDKIFSRNWPLLLWRAKWTHRFDW